MTCALRTPLCKARKGAYKDATYDELLYATFQAAKENINIDPASIGDICVGTVTTPNGPNTARVAALAAGFRESKFDSADDSQHRSRPDHQPLLLLRPDGLLCHRQPDPQW